MKLKYYLMENRITQKQFAEMIKCSYRTIWAATTQKEISLEIAKRIVKATNGEVTFDDLGPQPDKKLKMKKEENIDKEHNENK